jgi:hypothetical protein
VFPAQAGCLCHFAGHGGFFVSQRRGEHPEMAPFSARHGGDGARMFPFGGVTAVAVKKRTKIASYSIEPPFFPEKTTTNPKSSP